MVQLATFQLGSDNGLAPTRRQAIIWTNTDPIHWRIYAALGGDEIVALKEHINESWIKISSEKMLQKIPNAKYI